MVWLTIITDEEEETQLSQEDIEQKRGKQFKLGNHGMFIVVLESILYGHDDWVYSVRWHPTVEKEGISQLITANTLPLLMRRLGKEHQPMALLSASMDRTMAIWRPDPETGVWLNDVRVGEMGGNTLGFYGGLFGPEGLYILAHGYNGAFHLWKRQATKIAQGRVFSYTPVHEIHNFFFRRRFGRYRTGSVGALRHRFWAFWRGSRCLVGSIAAVRCVSEQGSDN